MRIYYFVDLVHLQDCWRWPFAVKMDFGRYFVTSLNVNPGQVAKQLVFMVLYANIIKSSRNKGGGTRWPYGAYNEVGSRSAS